MRHLSPVSARFPLGRIAQGVRGAIPGVAVRENANEDGTRILVRQTATQIKIEVTPVLRGTVHAAELRSVLPAAEEVRCAGNS